MHDITEDHMHSQRQLLAVLEVDPPAVPAGYALRPACAHSRSFVAWWCLAACARRMCTPIATDHQQHSQSAEHNVANGTQLH